MNPGSWLAGLVVAIAACSGNAPSGPRSPTEPATVVGSASTPAAQLPTARPPEPTRAAPLASDAAEPQLLAAGTWDSWDDAPNRAPAFCPSRALPAARDESCSGERGRVKLADALALPVAEVPEDARCSSAWSAELSVAARARPARAELRQRDGKLAQLEACAGTDAELVRLTRVMLWPECADALAVETPSAQITVALRGYALAAKLARLVFTAPNQPLPHAASSGPEAPIATAKAWTETQAVRLRRANQALSTLPTGSHGRAAAELALGQAWNRLLHTRLDLPPLAPAARGEARELLRQALAPYVAEAAPIADRAAHAATVVSEWPLLRAFQPGQPNATAEAARALVLPPLPALTVLASSDTELRLAAGLPSYVAGRMLPLERVSGSTLRALLQQGFDPALRRALAERDLSATDRLLVGHGRTVLAIRALAAEQAARAAELLRDLPEDNAATLASIASALATSLSGPSTKATSSSELVPLANRTTSSHLALLSYDAWRLGAADPTSAHGLLEARARELATVPALAACLPSGFIREQGCVCPSVQTLY